MTLHALAEITWGMDDPFLEDSSSSDAVFAGFDAAINGIGFMVDWNDDQLQGPNTIPLYRYGGQLDAGVRPGEASLSREDLWRRTVASFHHGAGQRWADRKDSDEFRFRASKGVDPWHRDRLTLLNDVTQQVVSAGITEARSLPFNTGWIYYIDAGVYRYVNINAADGVAGTDVISGMVGTGTGTRQSIAPTSTAVYILFGTFQATQVNVIAGGGTVMSTWATAFGGGILDCIGVAHGRILVASILNGSHVYDATTTTPALVGNLQDRSEQIASFAEGTGVIYAATQGGYGLQAKIYSITYDPASATLGPLTVAGMVPMGEKVQAAFGYLGFLFIGTDTGFRMCRQSADGALTIGPLVPITGGVASFTAIGPYVYFSWPNYDSTSCGIGRIDIATFTDADLVPAYASDLMAPVAGTVPTVFQMDNSNPAVTVPRPWFVVGGTGGGLFQRHASSLVASGTLDTGLIGYDLAEQKDLMAVDVRTEPLAGTVELLVAPDEAAFATLDVSSTAGSVGMYMPTRHIGASRHELRLTLTQGSTTTAPIVSSVTLLAYPAVQRGEVWTIPFIVQDDVLDNMSYPNQMDFWEKMEFIRNLAIPGTAPVHVQLGSGAFDAHIADYQTSLIKLNEYGRPQATMRVQFKNMDRRVA